MKNYITIMLMLLCINVKAQTIIINADSASNIIVNNYGTLIENNQGTVNVNNYGIQSLPEDILSHERNLRYPSKHYISPVNKNYSPSEVNLDELTGGIDTGMIIIVIGILLAIMLFILAFRK